MKTARIFSVVLVLLALALSACGSPASAPAEMDNGKPQSSVTEIVGTIEAMNGNEWIVNGQTVTVPSSMVESGNFKVGDTIRVEVEIKSDGSVSARNVDIPSVGDNSNSTNENSNDDVSDENSNESPAGDQEQDTSQSGITFDDGGTEAFGTVDSISGDQIVIGGQTFTLADNAEIQDIIAAGDFVKVHFVVNPDGTLSIVEIEISNPASAGGEDGADASDNENSNEDSSNENDDNSNEDDGDDNSNEDGGDDNSNEDDGDDNSNEDDGDDDNSNEDNTDDDNSNEDDSDDDDDNSNDDNSGGNDDSDENDNSGSGGSG